MRSRNHRNHRNIAHTQARHPIHQQLRGHHPAQALRHHRRRATRVRRARAHPLRRPRANRRIARHARAGRALHRPELRHARRGHPLAVKLDHGDEQVRVDGVDVRVEVHGGLGVAVGRAHCDDPPGDGLVETQGRGRAAGEGHFEDAVVGRGVRGEEDVALGYETGDVFRCVCIWEVCRWCLRFGSVDYGLIVWIHDGQGKCGETVPRRHGQRSYHTLYVRAVLGQRQNTFSLKPLLLSPLLERGI